MTIKNTALYASVGPHLTHYDIDLDAFALTKRSTVTLPANVQYVWPHAAKPFMYAASSSRISRDAVGTEHFLSGLAIDRQTGAVAAHGTPVRLPHRPVHVTTDRDSQHALVAFNAPSNVAVFRIRDDATVGELVPQRSDLDTGVFAHQIRVTADDQLAFLVTRGNPFQGSNPHAMAQRDAGALKVFQYRQGVLGDELSIAPGAGLRFGPRHLDFHPTAPWVFVSLETQNKLCVFKRDGNRILPEPVFERELLATPDSVPSKQGAGTIHVHPNGRFVYCVNRGHVPVDYQGEKVLIGADNTFAVFAVDPVTGEPSLIQHIDSGGICARTFALHPSGRMLVAANCETHRVKQGEQVREVSGNLATFEVRGDGTLRFVRKYDVALGPEDKLFWMGMVNF
jgi:6-phosphogluconolactonase (cycloisomerase 2 family)